MPTIYDMRRIPEQARTEILTESVLAPQDMYGSFEFAEPKIDWQDGKKPKPVELNGVKGVELRTPGARKDLAFVHIHGGGFFGGSPVTGYRIMSALKTRYNLDSFSVDYTRTPIKKAPCQIEECADFYRGVLALGYERILLAGESAGGNLVVALTLWLKDRGEQLPAAVAACSPALDMSGAVDKPMHDMFSDSEKELVKSYVGGMSVVNPYISPIYGSFDGFPPLLLQVGSTESLQYEALYMGQILEKQKCDCTVSIWEGAPHAIGLDVVDTWFSRRCMEQILTFFREKAGL